MVPPTDRLELGFNIRDDGTAGDPTRFTFGRTTGAFTAKVMLVQQIFLLVV
jgi:hypothetical protein